MRPIKTSRPSPPNVKRAPRAPLYVAWLEAAAGRAPVVTISAEFARELAAVLRQRERAA